MPLKIKSDGVNDPGGKRARIKKMAKIKLDSNTNSGSFSWKMEQLSYQGVNKESVFNGVEYYAAGGKNTDIIKFQITDEDNVLGHGAGFVIEEFGDVYSMPDAAMDIILYESAINPLFYITCVYEKDAAETTTHEVVFTINLFRHLVE